MPNDLTLQIATLAGAFIPLSLIITHLANKFFYKYNPKLSRITTVCTSIRGTLTKGQLKVKSVIFDKYKAYFDEEDELLQLEDIETKDNHTIEARELQKDPSIKLMATITSLCRYKKIEKIEKILLGFFKTCAIDDQQIQHSYEIISSMPTDEDKKFSTVVAIKKKSAEIFALSKGNPYKILERCQRMLIQGKKVEIDSQLRRKLKKKIEKRMKSGEKIICFAFKALPKKRLENYNESFTENDLVLIGWMGLSDRINIELTKYIEKIKEAGIKIYVISKAKERKAIATSQALKIINPNYFEAIVGKDLLDINDQKLQKMLSNKEKDYIFAETSEEQKDRIIQILQSEGKIIAYANDDENGIKTICQGIENGQKLKEMREIISYHSITSKISEIAILLLALILKAPMPLTLSLIIVLDLFINLPLELALGKNNLNKKTENPDRKNALKNGLLISLILAITYFWSLTRFGWIPFQATTIGDSALLGSISITFLLLSFIQIYNANRLNGKHQNPYLILTSIISIMILYIITQLYLSDLTIVDWGIILFALLIYILIIELPKHLRRKNADPLQ